MSTQGLSQNLNLDIYKYEKEIVIDLKTFNVYI